MRHQQHRGPRHQRCTAQHAFKQDAASLVAHIEAQYVAQGFQAAFRIPFVPAFDPLRQHLAQVGYNLELLTQVKVAAATPDAAWAKALTLSMVRTAQGHRGQGLAGQVLASIDQVACARGIDRVFLQVEQANSSANALYQRAGFSTAWCYAYWRKSV